MTLAQGLVHAKIIQCNLCFSELKRWLANVQARKNIFAFLWQHRRR